MTSRDIFSTVRSEGGLLPPDILRRITEGDPGVGGLSPSDYHLEGEKINEAVNRSWNRAVAAWRQFRQSGANISASEPGTTVTRERWLLPLFTELGYGRLQPTKALDVAGRSYNVSHLWHNTPLHLVGFRVDLDKRTQGVVGASRATPHGLVQDLLNRSEAHLWAIVSNGLKLRLLRDSVALVRQAYVEFDLEAMMEGQVYADFVLLWQLCHQSRVEAPNPHECWLEQWVKVADEQGTRALDHLRDGVEAAIVALGQGFLQHKGNRQLMERLRSGELSTQDYYRQLLRMVYRLIFLFVAEDRDFLFAPGTPESAKARYREHFSTARLRSLADRRRGSRHVDLWRALRLVFGMLKDDRGCPELGIPALNSFLWSQEATADLAVSDMTNRALLDAIRALAFNLGDGKRRSVDFRNLGPEEFGSVYESLLELQPAVNADAGAFTLATADGNERKTTGSYYTPDALIQQLLDVALDPVIERACNEPNREAAVLGLKVVDPACGSGHFLIAASHRLAKRLASLRTSEEEPSPEAVRHALRDVIGRCIHGVDVNPMAVELCKVGLWMEALDPGKPLSFLDHKIQVGNALLGVTPELLGEGLPDEAFVAGDGDDKAVATAARKQNRKEREKETLSLFGIEASRWGDERLVAGQYAAIDNVDDGAVSGVHERQRRFEDTLQSDAYMRAKCVADAWCSAFVWDRTASGPPHVLSEALYRAKKDLRALSNAQREEVSRLSTRYQFFHWHLAFPGVFSVIDAGAGSVTSATWGGGFDVVLGNPPFVNAIGGGVDARTKLLIRYLNPKLGGTADLGYLFLGAALRLIGVHGRVGLIQPRAMLNATPVLELRRALTGSIRPNLLYVPNRSDFFPGAAVYVCAVVLGSDPDCLVSMGDDPATAEWRRGVVSADNWWSEAGRISAGLPVAMAPTGPSVGSLFEVSASMTTGDAYDVRAFVQDSEAGGGQKLMTTGLIDPGVNRWGTMLCRYLKADFKHPRIQADTQLSASLQRRLQKSRRPKLLVAGLSKRVECLFDSEGECIGAVATFSIFHPTDNIVALGTLCDYLNSDEVTKRFIAELGGNAMGGGSPNMTRDFLESLPVPAYPAP